MKRYEMLNIIYNAIREHNKNSEGSQEAKDVFAAPAVLEAIEKAGMLPPAYDKFKDKKNMYMDILMVNQWEDEEETLEQYKDNENKKGYV